MKIGLVCPYNITRGGGVQEAVRAMRTELRSRGHQVKIITPEPRDISRIDKRGIIFMGGAADFRSPLSTTAQVSASIDYNAIDAMLTREKFDILHFHEPWVPMLSWQILSRSTTVNVATFHAKLPETMMSRTVARVVTPYTKSVLRYLHTLTAVSDAASEYVSSLTDRPISIVPNGVDLKRFHPPRARRPSAHGGLNTILYIGRLERRKGVKYLLKAFAELQSYRPDTALIIAGDGPNRARLEEQARVLGLRNVEFLGFIGERKKIQLLQTCDLFCSPAVFGESFGIVLLEAMAAGAVTVAGDNPGYASVMRDLGSISLINPRDGSEFARRMDMLLYDRDLRAKWKRWAKRYVQQFDYARIVDQYEAIYERALVDPAPLPAPSKRWLWEREG